MSITVRLQLDLGLGGSGWGRYRGLERLSALAIFGFSRVRAGSNSGLVGFYGIG